MVDAHRADAGREPRHGGERHERSAPPFHVQALQRREVALELGQQLEDHPVLVVGGEDGRDLARAVGVVQRLLDLLGSDAQRGGALAIDLHVYLRVRDLEVGCDVLEAGQVAQLGEQIVR